MTLRKSLILAGGVAALAVAGFVATAPAQAASFNGNTQASSAQASSAHATFVDSRDDRHGSANHRGGDRNRGGDRYRGGGWDHRGWGSHPYYYGRPYAYPRSYYYGPSYWPDYYAPYYGTPGWGFSFGY